MKYHGTDKRTNSVDCANKTKMAAEPTMEVATQTPTVISHKMTVYIVLCLQQQQ